MLARLRSHARLLVTIVFVVACVAALLVRPPMTHWSPDGDGKYIQMTSIRVEGGHLKYDVPYVGKPYDPHMAAVPLYRNYYDLRNGEIRIAWPELFVLMTYPLHATLGWFGLFILPLAGGAASVHLTGLVAERIRKGTGWLASLVVAAATPVIIYSTLFWEHTPALALAMGALWLIVPFFSDHNRGRVFGAAALLGLASAGLRGEMGLLTAAIVGAVFLATPGRRRWWVPAFAIVGFVVGSAPAWAMNYAASGRILPSNAVKSVPKGSLSSLTPDMLPHFFVGKLATHLSPLAAWTTTLAPVLLCVVYYVGRRAGDERWRAAVMVAAASVLVPASLVEMSPSGALEDRFHGWLAMCPVLALGMLASTAPLPKPLVLARKMVLYAALLYAAIVATILGVLEPEEVDLEWGPRYWIALFPLTAILVAVSYDAFTDAVRPLLGKLSVVIPVALFLVGVAFIVVGMVRVHVELAGNRLRTRMALISNGPEPLLMDAFWITPMDFDNYQRRPSFLVEIGRPEEFPPWLCDAAAHGLTSFDLVTGLEDPAQHPFFFQPIDCDLHVVKGEEVRYTGILKFLHVRIEPGRDQRKYGRHRVYGLIYAKYAAIGEEGSYLGRPISDEMSSVAFCGGGRYVQFQRGRIDFCPNVGAWAHDDPTQPYPGRDR